MFGELVGDDITVPRQILAGDLPLPSGLQEWLPQVLPELAELAAAGPDVLVGDTATHSDLRPDNLLIDTHGVCWAVDWNWLTLGPRWVDWAGLLPLAQYHGIDTFAAVTSSPLTADVPKNDLDVFMAVIAAYMMKNTDAPPPPGCTPALREHQRLSAWTFLDWLAVRRGW
jgi:thiamine kinase-like enzyme